MIYIAFSYKELDKENADLVSKHGISSTYAICYTCWIFMSASLMRFTSLDVHNRNGIVAATWLK